MITPKMDRGVIHTAILNTAILSNRTLESVYPIAEKEFAITLSDEEKRTIQEWYGRHTAADPRG